VWFWRPFAGVKFARRQRVARMTGSTKQLVPGEQLYFLTYLIFLT